jgi:hypothetical protein
VYIPRLLVAIGWTYGAAWFFCLPFRLFKKRTEDVVRLVLWFSFLMGLWPKG